MRGMNGGIDHSGPLQQQTLFFKNLVDRVHKLGRELMPFQQAPEVKDLGLVRQCVFRQFQPGKPPHGFNLGRRVFRVGIRQGLPLLEKEQPQHRCQGIELTPAPAGRGVVRLDGRQQRASDHRLFHLGQEVLPPGLPFLLIKAEGVEGGPFHAVTRGCSLKAAY